MALSARWAVAWRRRTARALARAWTRLRRGASAALNPPAGAEARADADADADGHAAADTSLPALRRGIRACAARGRIHPQAGEIALRALDFGSLRVDDIMVPRNRVQALPRDVALPQLRRILLEDGHSRMPVYDGTLDNIVGILVAKDVLALAWEGQLVILQDLLQPPYFAPETMHAADLLKALQRRRLHFAVVVDELGGTAGIVTLEDLLEELVGDIYSEHDDALPAHVHHEADGTVTLEGIMPVREANRELSLALPEDERFSTVGGLCVSVAGRIPEQGQRLELPRGVVLEVVDASPRNVTRVRLQRPHLPPRGGQAPRTPA